MEKFSIFRTIFFRAFLFVLLSVGGIAPARALFVSPPKDPIPLIKETFPDATKIADKQGEIPAWSISSAPLKKMK